MRTKDFPAGTVIFRAGDSSVCAFRILQGTVELVGKTDETRLAQLGPGEVFGEMSLIEERPHALTARALTDAQLSSLTSDEFESMLTADPVAMRVRDANR